MRLISMSSSDIEKLLEYYEKETKNIKEEIYRISWYMRGGVTSHELLHEYSYEDRMIMYSIIKENIEATKTAKMPLI